MSLTLDRPRASRPARLALILALLLGFGALAYLLYTRLSPVAARLARLRQYWSDPRAHQDWAVRAGERCGDAPFLMPTDGLIGFAWGDSFRPGKVHQGLDIFGPTGPDGLGETPVVAAHDGYLTRLPAWRSAVILRIPKDPLQPERQIWIYYTHMADASGNSFISPEFPPGTAEAFVPAGALLGYQGNYSGEADSPVGMHLHFSIVLDDGRGRFRDERDIGNTLDPSPYLGVEVNADRLGDQIPTCRS